MSHSYTYISKIIKPCKKHSIDLLNQRQIELQKIITNLEKEEAIILSREKTSYNSFLLIRLQDNI
jgi:hypothetical protein